jgi:hypothetical protein
MRDASIALMTKVGIPIKKTLDYLQEYFSHNELLSKGAYVLRHIQREQGINPDINYTLALYSGEIISGEVDGSIALNIASPAKGGFTANVEDTDNWIFDAGTTELDLVSVTHHTSPEEYVVLSFEGTAQSGEMTIAAGRTSVMNYNVSSDFVYEIGE